MTTNPNRAWLVLANAACNGTLTLESRQLLQKLLRENPDVRRQFVAYMDMHATLAWELRADNAVPAFAAPILPQTAEQEDTAALLREILEQERAAAEQRAREQQERLLREAQETTERQLQLPSARHEDSPSVRYIVIPRSLFFGLIGSVAAAILVLLWLALPSGEEHGQPTQNRDSLAATPPAPAPTPVTPAPVATLRSSHEAQWGEHDISPGRPLVPGDYRLERGLALVQLNGGATTLLEAPVDFSLVDGDSLRLAYGKVVGRCEEGERLIIRTPNAEVVDLGTEFGVVVDDQGVTTTHVFEGVVRMTPMANGRPGAASHIIGAGSARQVDATGTHVSTVAPAELTFVRTQEFEARRAADTSPYHRWLAYSYELRRRPDVVAYYTLDDVTSTGLVLNLADATSGRLNGEPCQSMLLSLADRVVPGRFPGKTALRFDGSLEDYIVVRDEEMLTHCDTVTIAAWIRPDWTDRYVDMAIVSRRESEMGLINYQMGLLGNVPTSLGSLQWLSRPDGLVMTPPQWSTPPVFSFEPRWMHIAVSSGTEQAVVYLDGREVARFASHTIDRRPHTLLIGAAQHGSSAQDVVPRFFFNGVIDELLIINGTMSASQIQELYQRTRPEL